VAGEIRESVPSNRNRWRAPLGRCRNAGGKKDPGCFSSARKGAEESRANTLKKRRTCECPYAHALPAITTSEALELARRAPGLRCGLIYGYNDGNSKFRSNINDRQRRAFPSRDMKLVANRRSTDQ
jgi:hypothetical protein